MPRNAWGYNILGMFKWVGGARGKKIFYTD